MLKYLFVGAAKYEQPTGRNNLIPKCVVVRLVFMDAAVDLYH